MRASPSQLTTSSMAITLRLILMEQQVRQAHRCTRQCDSAAALHPLAWPTKLTGSTPHWSSRVRAHITQSWIFKHRVHSKLPTRQSGMECGDRQDLRIFMQSLTCRQTAAHSAVSPGKFGAPSSVRHHLHHHWCCHCYCHYGLETAHARLPLRAHGPSMFECVSAFCQTQEFETFTGRVHLYPLQGARLRGSLTSSHMVAVVL